MTRCDVALGRVPDKGGLERVSVGERGPYDVQRRAPALCSESGPRLGQGSAIKAYRVVSRTHSVCPYNTQGKPPLVVMKFFVSFPFALEWLYVGNTFLLLVLHTASTCICSNRSHIHTPD